MTRNPVRRRQYRYLEE